jgi:Zn-dependent protease
MVAVLFGSVAVHELAHTWFARRYGISVSRIVLLPIGGMSVIDEFAMPSEAELRVSLAGPLMSFLLCAAATAVYAVSSPVQWLSDFALYTAEVNLLLGVFNLLPAFPLDGGRAWRALRQRSKSFIDATREAASLSRLVVALLLVASAAAAILSGDYVILFWNGIIAVFIFVGANGELDAAMFKVASEGLTVRDAMRHEIVAAGKDQTALDAFELARDNTVTNILLVSEKSFGVVPVSAIAQVPQPRWGKVRLKELAYKPITCGVDEDALQAWKKMRESGTELAPVVDGGELVGVVSQRDIERLVYIRRVAIASA